MLPPSMKVGCLEVNNDMLRGWLCPLTGGDDALWDRPKYFVSEMNKVLSFLIEAGY
jgi:hypothetical protein